MNKEAKTLYRDGAFWSDEWTVLAEDADFSGRSHILIPFDAALMFLSQCNEKPEHFGVLVDADDDVEALAPHLDSVSVVAISFPGFADGRGFSSARLLRERLNFTGEIRAMGHYILDQMPLLARCGVDAFMISSDKVRAGLERGEWPEVTHYYQPVAADGADAIASRPWLRRKSTHPNRTGESSDRG
ncbi:Uncharacterized conserved protein, DUF934 family [Cohaesibacter sp. ES.047]|uniref:DUF934 domain-containing protein n=1 Tax=Cohaesibacter sp. ES.047 TaxID=1798205 RepID=UPI000BBFE0C5|nr:DUF934 domain-containing protein [Cohaesibacter sp. ES.047]SNY93682.1 Uncharacterized conserved protein, DUF934 family [Cohaesibacter sp. ES.047]